MMGFLSALSFLIIIIVSAWASASSDAYKNKARKEATKRGKKYYCDNKGKTYAVDTGMLCCEQVTSNGHYIMMEIKTGRVVQDFTQEQWDKRTAKKAYRIIAHNISNNEFIYLEKATNRTYKIICVVPYFKKITIKYLDTGELKTIKGESEFELYW